MLIKINGIGLRQARSGQVLHKPSHAAVSILLHTLVLSAFDGSHSAEQVFSCVGLLAEKGNVRKVADGNLRTCLLGT